MEDNGNSTSECDSDYEINLRLRGKRRHALSDSSESTDSSIGVRRRKKFRCIVSSDCNDSQGPSNNGSEGDSESESSESSGNGGGNVRWLRNHELSSDSEDIVRPIHRRRRNRSPCILFSDEPGHSSDDQNATNNAPAARMSAAVYPPPAGSFNELSDSGDDQAEKCAICLRGIQNQEVGCPEGCDHMFCLICLVEWAKKSNKCPLDRQQFSIILVRESKQGEVVRQLQVEEPPPIVDYEDFINCVVCGAPDREDELLLCDGCDRGFHLDCLSPPLEAVPDVDEWFCPHCSVQSVEEDGVNDSSFANEDGEGNDGEIGSSDVPTDGRRSSARLSNRVARTRSGRTLRDARTRQSALLETFRPLIRYLIDQQESDVWTQPSTSSSAPQPSTSRTQPRIRNKSNSKRPSAASGRKPTRKKKRKTTRRRRVSIRKKVLIENDDGSVTEEVIEIRRKAVRRRRKKRIVARKRKTTARSRRPRCEPSSGASSTSGTVRGRLARTLGMMAPTTPRQLLPEITSRRREAVCSGANASRSRAGIPTLHIFEPRNELAPVSSGSEDEAIGNESVGLLARRRAGVSSRHLERNKAVELLRSSSSRHQRSIISIPEPSNTSTDLLGSILESQTIWHSRNANVIIRTDGTVEHPSPQKPDVRSGTAERVTKLAPVHPTPGSQSPGFRPYGGAGPNPEQQQGPASGPVGGGQVYGTPRNARERYTSFFNSIPSGPTPFQRGGPPLRFRMPVRPQLRRIPLHRRTNRQIWQQGGSDGEGQGEEYAQPEEGEHLDDGDIVGDESTTHGNDDEVDLYSDIETNNTEKDDDGDHEGEPSSDYPPLGPPPEPPAFLLGIGSEDTKKDQSDVYDPAEPCDSDEEMVIDESQGQKIVAPLTPPPIPPSPPQEEKEIKDECPILSIYSSASVEFSRQDADERARAFANIQSEYDNNSMDPEKEKINKESEKETLVEDQKIPSSSNTPSNEPIFDLTTSGENIVNEEKTEESCAAVMDQIKSQEDNLSSSEADAASLKNSVSNNLATSSPAVDEEDDSSLQGSPASSRSGSLSPLPQFDSEPPLKKKKRSSGDIESGSEMNDSILPKSSDLGLRVTTGLEGLDVEEVSSEMEENEFEDNCSISSLSLSDLSNQSRRNSPLMSKKKRKKKKRQRLKSKSDKCASEEGEIASEKDKKSNNENRAVDENKSDNEKRKKRRSKSKSSDRQVLGSKENKKTNKEDLSWKKSSRKDKNYREGRKQSKERGRSKERRSSSPRKERRKGKDKKKTDKEKRKEIERYDVRKIVKNKEVRKTDAFGRDILSRSVSLSRSKSRSQSRSRGRGRNVRRNSRTPSRSLSRGFRRGRSPIRRRFRSRSRSSPSPRTNKKKNKSSDRKGRSRSRGLRRSWSRRRSVSRSPRGGRLVKKVSRRKSWSRSLSLSPPHSPSPLRVRRSVSPLRTRRSLSRSWSRPRSPLVAREPSIEKLTVVLTSKDKKKKKKRKDEKRTKRSDSKRRKTGNSKEVFASGDNVLVSVNFSRTNKSGNTPPVSSISPMREVTKKKKRTADESIRGNKKSKASAVSKTVVDAALATSASKRKKLTRLNEKEAEVILSRKPVAVIDLDISPYREQTPSPVNVVVVSDSGSGDEGKAPTPPITNSPSGPVQSIPVAPPVPLTVSAPYLLASSGPKTPPEPPIKFSISKAPLLRPIANPLADEGDDEEEGEAESERHEEQESEGTSEVLHKGPNTPPEPRGPSTPKSPPSPQTSPDAYDPFEPTKSHSPSPVPDVRETAEKVEIPIVEESQVGATCAVDVENMPPPESIDIAQDTAKDGSDLPEALEGTEGAGLQLEIGDTAPAFATTQPKNPAFMKKTTPQPIAPVPVASLPIFSLPSPNKTPNRQQGIPAALQVSGIQRLQHRLGSPVNKAPLNTKTTPEKRGTDLFSTGNYQIRNAGKRNGDNKPRPLQDATNETVDMDDSPYSPASSEGDDLFDPPAEPTKPSKPAVIPYKPTKATPAKTGKFDLLFGSSPMKNGGKKPSKQLKGTGKTPGKSSKKPGKKGISMKMDEDQLRILDDLPSSAVELQVKDKFLKKLNRQERVVDEVKTVLKPHYARKHITKEEYKDILRKAVPKICHSKSGEINPSKIQNLIEAYVRKFRHAKKKASGGVQKPKLKKSNLFS